MNIVKDFWLQFKCLSISFQILNRYDDNLTSKRNPIGRQASERRLRAASEANLLAGGSNIHSK